MAKSKVAIYTRVSTRDQNPENQKIELLGYAKNRNWKFDVFEEKESTRKTRPVKERVLKLLRQGNYETLLIWKLDRWGRSVAELSLEIEELFKKGINFISLKDSLDLSTASGRLQFHVICAFSEFERGIISERTIAGLERARAKGKTIGRPKKDPRIFNHYCGVVGCRVKIEQNRRFCDKHLKKRHKKKGFRKKRNF